MSSLTKLQKPQTQRERNNHNRELGKKGESLISSSLKRNGFWRLKQINLGDGTKCDFIAAHRDYGAFMLEIKTTDTEPVIAYSWITENERKALIEFEGLIGRGHAFIVGLWLKENKRAFLIPWYRVSDKVCSGGRGSIKMTDFPELAKVAGGWDLSGFAVLTCFADLSGLGKG